MRPRTRPPQSTRSSRELRWIRWLRKMDETVPTPGRRAGALTLGVGDDAALWRPTPGMESVLTVDVLVEGTHFRRDWLTFRELGSRAVSSSVSDLAAMAARPACLLVSIVADEDLPDRAFHQLYRGIRDTAVGYGARIAGGNLSSGPLSISITAIGELQRGHGSTRSGARPGDEIWVSGSPGLARLGLLALSGRRRAGSLRPGPGSPLTPALRAFRSPVARVREASTLARSWCPTAVIDLSDGLSTDLGHVLQESRRRRGSPLGAVVEAASIERLPHLARAARSLEESPVESCLHGGEDYELLFTVAPGELPRGRQRGKARVRETPLTRVGRITERPGLWLETAEGPLRRVARRGWEHF